MSSHVKSMSPCGQVHECAYVRAIVRLLVTSAGSVLFATAVERAQSSPMPPHAPKPILIPEANRIPDANARMEMQQHENQEQLFTAANVERKRQLDHDSALLLRFAAALNAEMGEVDKGNASADVLREIDGIEKLARAVKDKMTLTMGGK